MRRRRPVGVPRYCGRVKIAVRYIDAGAQYRCVLSVGGERVDTQIVGEPKVLDYAVDSPVAYDNVARTALVFSVGDGKVDESDLEVDRNGDYRIRRVPRK